MKTAGEIVDLMMSGDAFSKWMGIELIEISPGYCHLRAKVNAQMLNGFDILHGGISYSLSDSALAFASNAHGNKAVSIETSIAHLRPVYKDDVLDVYCEEIKRGKSIGIYSVRISNQKNIEISRFKGTVHISDDLW